MALFEGLLPPTSTDWVELRPEGWVVDSLNGVTRVTLNVDEPSGIHRRSFPVTSGIPLPEAALRDDSCVRLLDEQGFEQPLQAATLARWPDESIKWMLLDFQTDLEPNHPRRLTLEYGNAVRRSAMHPSAVTIFTTADSAEIQTGALRFSVSHGDRICTQLGNLSLVFTARSFDGTRDGIYTGHVDDWKLETSGPLRTVVCVRGWHRRVDGRKSMPFVVHLTAWAGCPILGIQHTFIISDDPLTTFFRGIGMRIRRDALPLVLVRDQNHLLPKEISVEESGGQLCVYLWPLNGPEMDLRSVLIRQPPDFVAWKEANPAAFERLEGGPMSPADALDFFTGRTPNPAMGDWRARTGKGMARTHEIFLCDPSIPDASETLRAFDRPSFAACTPSYYAHTAALGNFHPRDDANFPEIERRIDLHLEWLRRHREEWSKWCNFFDYGDYLSVYDAKRGAWWLYDDGMRGWNNGEVNTDHGPFIQFLRTADRKHLEFAAAIARHRMDVDQCHFEDDHPDFVGGVHRHHITEHWTGLIDGGHLWCDGSIDLYYLTGDRRALECAIEAAEYALRYGPIYAINRAETSRETANCLRVLARVYEATGNSRFADAAEAITRAYLCSFDEDGSEIPLDESLRLLQREFPDDDPWRKYHEILECNWSGHSGYQYIGYLAPAVGYWAEIGRTKAGTELAQRLDQYAASVQGDSGQFFGDRFAKTGDPRYVIPLVRNLKTSINVLPPIGDRGDRPESYGDARLDYLYGAPYVMAALYRARTDLHRYVAKPSASVKGHRATIVSRRSTESLEMVCLDLEAVANTDPRDNPFRRPLKTPRLPPLPAGAIGFQPARGNEACTSGYISVAAQQSYPSTARVVTPNRFALAGLPLGGTVTWSGVTWRFANPDSRHDGAAVVVLSAGESVTIPVHQAGRALHLLGHVHGYKESRKISQFSPVKIGAYELRYADGQIDTIPLINGIYFDGAFAPAYASDVEHVANFDWLHVYANMTDDRAHLNRMTLPLRPGQVLESLTFRAEPGEQWALLLAAATLETDAPRASEPPFASVAPDAITWNDLPGWIDVQQRRDRDAEGVRLYAPHQLTIAAVDGAYEVELIVSGDAEGASRLRIENADRQVLCDYCLAGNGQLETLRFPATAINGRLTLDLIPATNYATGSLFPEKGFVGSYGAWQSPAGNFTRIVQVRLRRAGNETDAHRIAPKGRSFGWLLPGASGDTFAGLVVDHEDADEGSPTTMKWRAGGFRADLPNGRYRVRLFHGAYAKNAKVIIDVFANGKKVIDAAELADSVDSFEAEATEGFIELTWHQPRTPSRVPRYAIRGIVFEPL